MVQNQQEVSKQMKSTIGVLKQVQELYLCMFPAFPLCLQFCLHLLSNFVQQLYNILYSFSPHLFLSLNLLLQGLQLFSNFLMQTLQFFLNPSESGFYLVANLRQIFLQFSFKAIEQLDSSLLYIGELVCNLFIFSLHSMNKTVFQIFPFLNKQIVTFDSNNTKALSFFCKSLIQHILFFLDTSHFLLNYDSLSFISVKLYLSSLTLHSIFLISSEHFCQISMILREMSSSVQSLTWFCLCRVIASSFCSILDNLYRLSVLERRGQGLVKLSQRGVNNRLDMISILYLKGYNTQLFIRLTAMIYLREKGSKKRREDVPVKDQRNKSIIEQLRSKLTKKSSSKQQQQVFSEQESRKKQNVAKQPQNMNKSVKYNISKSPQINVKQPHFSQSIIIHDLPESRFSPFQKKKVLSTVKCFDIQILNDLSASRYRAQAYIQLLQREREQKNRQVANLKQISTFPKEAYDLNEIQALKSELNEKTLCLRKYHKYFEQGKSVFLSVAMELIDSKNELNIRLSQQRKKQKQRSISQCIERVQKFISIYSNFLTFTFKKEPNELLTIDQLWNNVKYHQKIIQVLKENQAHSQLAKYHHENSLLRYEVNRLSQHNQQLLAIANSQNRNSNQNLISTNKHPSNKYSHERKQTGKNHFNSDSIVIEDDYQPSEIQQQFQEEISQNYYQQSSKDETPFQKLNIVLSPSVQHQINTQQMDRLTQVNAKLQKEISQYKSRIGILQVEKEYILDELETLQKNNSQIQGQLKVLSEQNSSLKQQIEELKNSYEVSKESEKVLEEQNQLLKEKIKLLFKTNGKETATVEELLKLLNRKELSNYHQALMELITQYERRISGLTDNYIYEKELKQLSLDFCIPLFNYAQSKQVRHEEIVRYIMGYDQIMARLKQNEIDSYLRKIKSYSIGIDKEAVNTIKEELKDYVYQLQIRLPTLYEDSEEDCSSSVRGSLNNSISN